MINSRSASRVPKERARAIRVAVNLPVLSCRHALPFLLPYEVTAATPAEVVVLPWYWVLEHLRAIRTDVTDIKERMWQV